MGKGIGRKQLQALRLKERKKKLKGLKEGQKGMKGCLDQAKQRKQRREKESKPGKTALEWGLVVDKEAQKGLKEGPNLFLSTDQDKEIGTLSGKKDEERGPGKAGRKTEKSA